jgi:hypothetical protein
MFLWGAVHFDFIEYSDSLWTRNAMEEVLIL